MKGGGLRYAGPSPREGQARTHPDALFLWLCPECRDRLDLGGYQVDELRLVVYGGEGSGRRCQFCTPMSRAHRAIGEYAVYSRRKLRANAPTAGE